MQGLSACFLVLVVGCASTVSRLPGEPIATSAGPAEGECESHQWLVIAPTRSHEPTESGRALKKRDDGLGLYRVGDDDPESIPGLSNELEAPPEMMHRHVEGAKRTQTDSIVAPILGGVGLVALGVGSYFFATSFETTKTPQADGSVEEGHEIKGGRIALGSALIGAGFGFGIAGIIVAPSAAESAKAEQAEYVFVPPEDSTDQVKSMVEKHNRAARDRCKTTVK
jgi:hypothetical protein